MKIIMKFSKKLNSAFNSLPASYIFYALSVLAFTFLKSSVFAYGWIAELYPLGQNFVPTLLSVIGAAAVMLLVYIFILKLTKNENTLKKSRFIGFAHILIEIFCTVLFIYTFVLLFGLDKGISKENFSNGLQYLSHNLAIMGLVIMLPVPMLFCEDIKRCSKAFIASATVISIVLALLGISSQSAAVSQSENFPAMNLNSENILNGADISFESLKQGEKADAVNLLSNNGCWTAQSPDRMPESEQPDVDSSTAEIKLKKTQSFNTAVIEEIGNQVQYFRLQVYINDEWVTVYQGEKIQSLKICSFNTVTADKIRLSIDKFRSADEPAKIKSLKLYNEPKRNADNFEVSVYQRLDGDVPTEIIAKGEDYIRNYAKFYDVYTTVIVFGAISWEENGDISFGENGEENFAREIDALKKIIDMRSDKDHQVKIIITALADGTGGDHGGVNVYMNNNGERIAQQTVELVNKYDFDGVDVDWEYPANSDDWANYDKFIKTLDEGINKNNKNKIISTALSAGNLGLSQETFNRLDQIQFMAYDGRDTDGYQSSLEQAQEGLAEFVNNKADISKINIGIAAYGRPVSGTPFWASWRDLQTANYWDSKYYNIPDSNQIYDGTFCSPAVAGEKTAYALFSGCGGVMLFRIGCDKTMDDPNSVAYGIKNTLDRYTIKIQ